jgi:autotransporter-associated beta strand protein
MLPFSQYFQHRCVTVNGGSGGLDARVRSSPATDTATLTQSELYRDFVTGDSLTFTVDGLTPGEDYEFLFTSYDSLAGATTRITNTTGGIQPSTSGTILNVGSLTQDGQYTLKLTATTDAAGRAIFLTEAVNNDGARINGIEVQAVSRPVVGSALLTASDGADADYFGHSVNLSGNMGLIGAFADDIGSSVDQGSAYVFRNLNTATGTVSQNVKLTASDGAAGDFFGNSVNLSGDNFVIGSVYGDTLVFNSGKAYTGSVSSVTTLDEGNASRTIDGISFVSQDDWVIGKTTDNNSVTLSSGDSGDVTASGKRVRIGQEAGSVGNQLTIQGTLTAREIVVGEGGGGSLTVGSTGQVTSDAIQVASAAGSIGVVSLSGGLLATQQITEGSGSGAVVFNSGTLRAQSNQAALLAGFETGDVTIQAGGGSIDSNGYSVGISTGIGGSGILTKQGAGTLLLAGNNSHAGGTVVRSGTLSVGHNNALGTGEATVSGGTLSIQTGFTPTNAITLAGGTLVKGVASGGSLVGSITATSEFAGGQADTTSRILAGTASSATNIQATFADTSAASNDLLRTSDVLHLSGIPPADIFVLELSMTSVAPGSYLGWLSGSNE